MNIYIVRADSYGSFVLILVCVNGKEYSEDLPHCCVPLFLFAARINVFGVKVV
jgi:hypothetical protein